MENETNQTLVLTDFSGAITISPSAIEQKNKALKASKKIITVVDDSSQLTAVSALRDLSTIRKQGKADRKAVVARPQALIDTANAAIADFLDEPLREENRLAGMINHYQLKQLEIKREKDREAEALKQQQEQALHQTTASAAELYAQAKHLRENEALTAKTSMERAKILAKASNLESDAMNLELAAEEIAVEAQTTGMAIEVVASKPKGLIVKCKLNYQITDPIAFVQAYPQFFKWDEELEVLKVKRRELVEEINKEKGLFSVTQFPEEVGTGRIPTPAGLRIFEDLRSSVR